MEAHMKRFCSVQKLQAKTECGKCILSHVNVPVLWEFTFVHYYSTYINKKRKPSIHLHNLQGHNLVVGMGSDFDLHELLKPHLSPALPHWKRTRVSGRQLDHNLKIC